MGAKRGVGGHTAAISHRSDEGPQTVKSCNNTYSTLPETIMEVENPQSVEATVDENTLPRGPFPCLWGRSISSNRKTVHRKPLVRRDGRTEGSPAKRRRQKSVFWFLVAMPLAASLAPSSFLFLVAMLELVFRLRVERKVVRAGRFAGVPFQVFYRPLKKGSFCFSTSGTSMS